MGGPAPAGAISVVIPTLNEEAGVAGAVTSVRDAAHEVIVADGGSTDATVARARSAGARVLSVARGRGAQLHAGAQAAGGDWLVFLHGDTRLEPGWAEALRTAPASSPGGAYRLAIDSPRRAYRVIEWGARRRARLLHLPYGDQALFVRRAAYEQAGGFRPLPLMEDVDFVRRLARLGPLTLAPWRAFTSPRRYEERGVWAGMLRNWLVLALYRAGWSPQRLHALYSGRSGR